MNIQDNMILAERLLLEHVRINRARLAGKPYEDGQNGPRNSRWRQSANL